MAASAAEADASCPHKKPLSPAGREALLLPSCVRDRGQPLRYHSYLLPGTFSVPGRHSCASINARPAITGVFRRDLLIGSPDWGNRFSAPELREDSPVGSGTASHQMAALCGLLPQDASRQRRMIPVSCLRSRVYFRPVSASTGRENKVYKNFRIVSVHFDLCCRAFSPLPQPVSLRVPCPSALPSSLRLPGRSHPSTASCTRTRRHPW